MPYKLVPAGTKFYVENKETGRRFSNRPLPKERAIRQMRALYAVENGYILRSRSKKSSPYNVRAEKRVANSRRRSMMQGGKKKNDSFITNWNFGAVISNTEKKIDMKLEDYLGYDGSVGIRCNSKKIRSEKLHKKSRNYVPQV